MTRNLSPAISRTLAVAILLGLIAGLWFGVAAPVVDRMLEYRRTIAQAEEQLPRLRRLAASTPMLQAQLAQLKRDPRARTRLLSGANESLAGADLQRRVNQIAVQNGAVIRSTQPLPAQDERGFRRISIRIAMEGGTAALQKIFYTLESSPTLLFIDGVQIRSRSAGRLLRSTKPNVAYDDTLAVRFDLSGYMGGPQS